MYKIVKINYYVLIKAMIINLKFIEDVIYQPNVSVYPHQEEKIF